MERQAREVWRLTSMHISGYYDGSGHGIVSIDGRPLSPAPSQKVWNHSPCGFAWGYGGSGPAQLALAILLAAGLPDERAVLLHQKFKWAIVARLPKDDPFAIDVDVKAWVRDA